jgi:predicted  nucleic acid-binding Zn-ribbon protein
MVTIKSERDDYYNRYRTTEREINKIRNEFDSLSNWKKVYEDQNEQLQSELAKVRNLLA